MQFDLVSPERSLASMDVTAVQIPGTDGDMTVMADHAPTITTLRPGVLKVEAGSDTHEFVVTGGFAEIGAAGLSVLAEQAVARADMTQETLDTMIAQAQESYDRVKGNDTADDVAKLMHDMVAMGTEIGLSPKQPNL